MLHLYSLYFHSEAIALKSENGKFINSQHLKNMNTLQQSRQKVNIAMLSLDDGLVSLQMRKHLGCYQIHSNLKTLLNIL